MRFKTRSTRRSDLDACRQLLSDRHLYDDEDQELLIRFWSELLAGGCAYSGLATDTSEHSIIAFSISVFVSNELAEHLQSAASPYIGRSMFHAWKRKQHMHLLDRQIGECNASDGVNVVTIHSGYRPFASMAEYADLRISLVDVFIREHIGLHMRSFTHELYGEYQDAIRAGGLRLEEYDLSRHPEIQADISGRLPFLTTLCRSGAEDQRGNYLSDMMAFAFTVPKFFFSLPQRQLLRVALENDEDEHIASRLYLSLPAIKKRWSTVYETIEKTEPNFLGNVSERLLGRRGQERRRKVLAYIRDCPEELHPYTRAVTSLV
jgi:hypothetical protein